MASEGSENPHLTSARVVGFICDLGNLYGKTDLWSTGETDFSLTCNLLFVFADNFNPFASIERTGTSKGKVKVRVICLNISFLT